jgi:hypothetical protein
MRRAAAPKTGLADPGAEGWEGQPAGRPEDPVYWQGRDSGMHFALLPWMQHL